MCCGKNRQQWQLLMQTALRMGAHPPGSNPVPVTPTAPMQANSPYARAARFAVGRPTGPASPGLGMAPQGRARLLLVPQRGPGPRS